MRVLVCGGRQYRDRHRLEDLLDAYRKAWTISHIISGGAPGADRLAEQWADDRQIPCLLYPAQWKRYGVSAGPIRNQQMLDEGRPDLVLAFPGGKGTADMTRRAHNAGVTVHPVT